MVYTGFLKTAQGLYFLLSKYRQFLYCFQLKLCGSVQVTCANLKNMETWKKLSSTHCIFLSSPFQGCTTKWVSERGQTHLFSFGIPPLQYISFTLEAATSSKVWLANHFFSYNIECTFVSICLFPVTISSPKKAIFELIGW